MTEDNVTIRSYFKNLGLSEEIADIYIALCAHGTQTISELSRHSGIERTRIYRMLEVLKQTKLIIVEVHYRREMLRAAPITNLQLLIDQKEYEVVNLKAGLPAIYSLLSEHSQEHLSTRVQFYKGDEGIRQLIWNETKAKSEVRCIIYNTIQHKLGVRYFESWVHECNKNNIRFRGIISNQFTDDQEAWYKSHQNERLKFWTQRYVNPTIFPINYSTIMYDNVVNFYNWKDKREVFGIEIHSKEIASAQEMFFDLLWEKSAPSNHVLEEAIL